MSNPTKPMTTAEIYEFLDKYGKTIAIELARNTLKSADFSQGLELLTEEQVSLRDRSKGPTSAYQFLEDLYYDGEIRYYELLRMCPKSPIPGLIKDVFGVEVK